MNDGVFKQLRFEYLAHSAACMKTSGMNKILGRRLLKLVHNKNPKQLEYMLCSKCGAPKSHDIIGRNCNGCKKILV